MKCYGWLVRLLHLLLITWSIVVPFTNDKRMLGYHALVIPMIMFHWYTNDVCMLTEIEKALTGERENTHTFIGSIVSPVYNFRDETTIVYVITFVLWLITMRKIQKLAI